MRIKVSSILFHRNGSGRSAGSIQVLFKVVRDREYKNMMATIFSVRDEECVNVVNLDKITDKLDPDDFRLIHKAVDIWEDSWDGRAYTQVFPFVVSQ